MILHQATGSARAEKRTGAFARWIHRGLRTALLTSALSLPSVAAWGTDSPQGKADGRAAGSSTARGDDPIALPSIPHLDPMPWMPLDGRAPTLKTDILITPTITPSGILPPPAQRPEIS